jgi:TPR repeat protein
MTLGNMRANGVRSLEKQSSGGGRLPPKASRTRSVISGPCMATDAAYRKNYVEAIKWYRLAADQDYADAQHNLGAMYDNGYGVPQDAAG